MTPILHNHRIFSHHRFLWYKRNSKILCSSKSPVQLPLNSFFLAISVWPWGHCSYLHSFKCALVDEFWLMDEICECVVWLQLPLPVPDVLYPNLSVARSFVSGRS